MDSDDSSDDEYWGSYTRTPQDRVPGQMGLSLGLTGFGMEGLEFMTFRARMLCLGFRRTVIRVLGVLVRRTSVFRLCSKLARSLACAGALGHGL